MEEIRLNKYLSDRGVCSRREADRMMEEGRITVNGQRASVGAKVTDADEIRVDGAAVDAKSPEKVIIAVHKPVGVVCTTREFPGEENILSLVDYGSRLYPVGRLDKDSEGLIFLTNDGNFAVEITKASGHHEKEYEVTVNHDLTDSFVKRMEKGVYLSELEKTTAACRVKKTGDRSFSIVLTQGLNRQIRRMCSSCGYEVKTLRRIRIMNVQLGKMKPGEWRFITGAERTELLAGLKKKLSARKENAGSRNLTKEPKTSAFEGKNRRK